MKRNSRLSLALHALSHMASEPDRVWTSAEIALHAGTNAVVVRRVFGKLGKAGLLTGKKGHAGGWRLAVQPASITLADIYVALEESVFLTTDADEKTDHSQCLVESALHAKVSGVLSDIEGVLIQRLGETSIMEIKADASS